MLAFISLLVLVGSWLLVSGLNRNSAEVKIERDERTLEALKKGKAALIQYAASEQWQRYRSGPDTKFQPGALPCPDRDNDGDSQGLCSNAVSRIGRLPWLTLGSDDLHDASGERLWYALSANFRKLHGTTVINSNTPGQLTVSAASPVSNVVAIIFAPGQPLSGQNRDPSNAALINDPASYLEGFNAAYDTFTSATSASDTFNDRLLVITADELMEAVEPVVAALIERDVKPFLEAYFTDWGRYPFPARFDAPNPGTLGGATTRPQSAFLGDSTQTFGLLPIASDVVFTWTGSSIITASKATVPLNFGSDCSVVSGELNCTFTMPGTLVPNSRFSVQAEFSNPTTSFAKPPDTGTVTVTLNGIPYALASPTITTSLTGPTTGMVSYEGTYTAGSCVDCVLTIKLNKPELSALTSKNLEDGPAYWFIANEWYRLTFYAVAPGYVPGGDGACSVSAPATCLTVNNLPSPYTSSNDKRAVLMLAGRSLNGALRPTANIADYLEGENATLADSVFENRRGPTRSFLPPSTSYAINDRVVVVAP